MAVNTNILLCGISSNYVANCNAKPDNLLHAMRKGSGFLSFNIYDLREIDLLQAFILYNYAMPSSRPMISLQSFKYISNHLTYSYYAKGISGNVKNVRII